jgi:hypothetical protein
VPDGADYPVDREGTVFGNLGGTNIYFAGGVNTLIPNEANFTAFTDIYTYDTGATPPPIIIAYIPALLIVALTPSSPPTYN